MAFSLFKRKDDFSAPPEGIPPLPDLPGPVDTKDLTSFGPSSAFDELAKTEAYGFKPAGPPYPMSPRSQPLPTMPPAPVFRPSPPPAPKPSTEEIEEIAEAIIAEKWQKFGKEIDELKRIQEDASASIGGMQERMANLEKKMDMLIQEILGKVDEYGKGVSDVGTELKAMQKVFNTTMPAFTENIKELQELVGQAKEKGFRKGKK